MLEHDLSPQAAANVAYYGEGEEIERYQREPYHAKRLALAYELLAGGLAPGARCCDLGAGSLAIAHRLHGAGFVPTVVDANEVVVTAARNAGYDAVAADLGSRLPWSDRSFAGVFAGEVLEHLYDPLAFLCECHRILLPGASLVVTTPNLAALQDRVAFLIGKSPRHVDPLHEYLQYHIRPFTVGMLRAAMIRAGFAVTAVKSNYVVLRLGDERRIRSAALAKVMPGLGGSLIAAGVRR